MIFDNERDKSPASLAEPHSMCAGNHKLSLDERDLAMLIRSVARSDEDAFATLYDRTSPLVYGLAVRMLGNTAAAEEVLCEAYDHVWRHANEYDDSACVPFTWLVTTTRNLALARLRSGGLDKVDKELLDSTDGRCLTKTVNLENCHPFSKPRSIVLSILDALSSGERQALELAYFSGLKATEIANHLSQSASVVKSLMRTGMIKLHERLEPLQKEE
jgi:RNA polymerase sigma-70 factor (ECF subfamily)